MRFIVRIAMLRFPQTLCPMPLDTVTHPITTATYSMTSDKSGYVYVMNAGSNALGGFASGDPGLTSTQPPFQGSRNGPANSTGVCPMNNDKTGIFTARSCDEIHELAWFNNNMFLWPANESLLLYPATTTMTTYSFPPASRVDPCATSGNCTGSFPPFPTADSSSPGGAMAIAASASNATTSTLWAIVPQTNLAGTLYAYGVSGATLTPFWTNVPGVSYSGNLISHSCSGTPPATSWFTPSFTEPTLAAGKAFVATNCAVTDGNTYTGCYNAAQTSPVQSGVLVFSSCSN